MTVRLYTAEDARSPRGLSKQQWRQIQACLLFWRSAAAFSQVHPKDHPVVRPVFESTRPLTEAELDALLGHVEKWS